MSIELYRFQAASRELFYFSVPVLISCQIEALTAFSGESMGGIWRTV